MTILHVEGFWSGRFGCCYNARYNSSYKSHLQRVTYGLSADQFSYGTPATANPVSKYIGVCHDERVDIHSNRVKAYHS